MNLEKIYYDVKKYIDTVDFSKLWPGFEPLKFALYTDKSCFFDGQYIEKTDNFLANTSIFYNGEWIAIWNVQEDIDPILLTSKIVHEMYHGYQNIHNEKRFFDDIHALYNYKYDGENIGLKLKENQLICELSTQFDTEKFNELLQIRKYRSASFEYAYHYEACVEQIEGTANFVELRCLEQLSPELFKTLLAKMKKRITEPENMIPVRVICYDIGALLLYVMTENSIPFDTGFSYVPFSEAILNGIEEIKPTSIFNGNELIERYYSEVSKTVKGAIEKNEVVTDTPCDLLAVNTYNAAFHENYIVSKYFVMFGSREEPKIEYGDFVIETHAYKIVTKIYRI